MLEYLIDFSLRRRGFVIFATLLLAAVGVWSATRVAIDAVPDITSPQVQVNTPVTALAPEEIETLVTVPIEVEMSGLPGLVELRSLSKFGLSQITMTFRDGTDLYRARQLVTERLTHAAERLPAGVAPALAPISTGLGEIVYYTVRYRPDAPDRPAERVDQLRALRLLHDFTIKPLLRATPGLAEVNAIGGYEKQIVIEPDPQKLADAGVSFDQLADVIARSTENAGGGLLELGGEAIVVRADTRARTLDDLANLPVKFVGAAHPLLIRDLAAVSIGSAVRTGASTEDGEETVTGAAVMLAGENSRLVARAVVARLHVIQEKLPPGIEIRVVYDRSDLVHTTIATVRTNLLEGAILVAAILFALLGQWRAAAIVTLAIPLSFLFMLTGMAQGRLSANLMSLGAIDFGLIVDGSIVMVEHILRRLAGRQHALGRNLDAAERLAAVRTAAHEVARPMFFGVLIILLVYVPVLALTGIEGKMFRPMALAVMLALGGALGLALTLMPVLCAQFLRGRLSERESPLIRAAKALYAPLLHRALRARWLIAAGALALVVAAGWQFTRLGAEFIPQLDEGAIAIQFIRGNSVGLDASVDLQRRSEKLLREKFPEIRHLFARLGTAEIAMDPMGPNTSDTYVFFHPRDTWRKANTLGPEGRRPHRPTHASAPDPATGTSPLHPADASVGASDPQRSNGRPVTKAELVDLIRAELTATIPGQTYLFTQPVQLRFNEIMAGARADLSLKIYGDDFAELERLAGVARDLLRTIPGGGDVEFDALGRVPVLEITAKRNALQRLNLHADEINHVVATALGGREAGALVEGSRRVPVVVRLPESRRLDLAALRDLPVRTDENDGVQVPLSRLADLAVADRVGTITREDTQRRVAILINVRGRDTEGFVRDATAALRRSLSLPPGYTFEFGGQFANLQAARARLALIVPAALALIFALIYATFGSARQAAMIFVCVPLAAVGGVAALWLRGLPFTIPAAVGFVALSGIAVLNGIMLLSFINLLRAQGRTVRDAVVEGTLTRLRPLLMTALVASLGFVPMALSTGPGAEVQRPLATVVIGGILTATFLTLVVLPILYDWIESRRQPKQPQTE